MCIHSVDLVWFFGDFLWGEKVFLVDFLTAIVSGNVETIYKYFNVGRKKSENSL